MDAALLLVLGAVKNPAMLPAKAPASWTKSPMTAKRVKPPSSADKYKFPASAASKVKRLESAASFLASDVIEDRRISIRATEAAPHKDCGTKQALSAPETKAAIAVIRATAGEP